MKFYYKCIKCLKSYPFSKDLLTCPDHSPYFGYLTVMYETDSVTFTDGHFDTSWQRYQDLLPIDSFPINFNEQKTPLVTAEKLGEKYGFNNLYIKDESKNPSGSFKDKESSMVVNMATSLGLDDIFTVSSGNAAVSTSAYAQKSGITCTCLVSKKLSVGKRFLISLYGGNIQEIDGNYEKIYRHAIDSHYPGWNVTPGINPLKDEGIKIIGFEIFDEIGVPDVIVVPSGNGTLLYGIYKAFEELKHFGFIDKLPQMIGVQVKGASPLKKSFMEGKDFVTLTDVPDSLAEGIIAEESYSSPKVMFALSETAGTIVEVTDKEIVQALKLCMSLESLIPEPTSAAVYAALPKLSLPKDKKIVLVQTAGGMKNLKEIMQHIISFSSKGDES